MPEDDILYPDKFAEKVRTHPKKPGKPFSFKGREFLIPIYREFHPTIKEKVIVYFGSRKIEKTEFILNMILYTAMGFQSWNTLYTIARRRQVRDFSIERLLPAINTSIGGCIRERYISHHTGVHNRAFTTGVDGVYNNVTLESSWNLAEGILGKETQMVISDESQSQQEGFFAMLNEMMTQSEWKWFIITGTARDRYNELATFWKQSTQNLWVVTCKYCGKKQIFSRKNDDGETEYKGMSIQNLFREVICKDMELGDGTVKHGCGARHLLQGWSCSDTVNCDCGRHYTKEHYTRIYRGCAFCKKPINPKFGRWKEFNPNAMYIGYHANQMMHQGVVKPSDMYKKLISPGYPKVRFLNEVLGEFYGGEGGAIPIEDVLACRRESYDYVTKSDKENNLMGIDTGKPNYVTIIDGNNDRILYQDAIEFRNTSERKDFFINLMDAFNIKQCVIDFGHTGAELAKDLQEEFGDRVKTCRYTSRPGNWYKYDEKDGLGHRIFKMEVDKVTACNEVINKFTSKAYKIPYGNKSIDKADMTFQHYVNIIWEKPDEKKPLAGTPSIKIGCAGPDHYFHTLVYCELGKVQKKSSPKIAVLGDKPIGRKRSDRIYDKLSEATRRTTGRFLRRD